MNFETALDELPRYIFATFDCNRRHCLTLETLRSKFEFSFVSPIHFLQK